MNDIECRFDLVGKRYSERATTDPNFRQLFVARCLTRPGKGSFAFRSMRLPPFSSWYSVKMCCGQNAGKDNNRKRKAAPSGAGADPAFQEIRGQADKSDSPRKAQKGLPP